MPTQQLHTSLWAAGHVSPATGLPSAAVQFPAASRHWSLVAAWLLVLSKSGDSKGLP